MAGTSEEAHCRKDEEQMKKNDTSRRELQITYVIRKDARRGRLAGQADRLTEKPWRAKREAGKRGMGYGGLGREEI